MTTAEVIRKYANKRRVLMDLRTISENPFGLLAVWETAAVNRGWKQNEIAEVLEQGMWNDHSDAVAILKAFCVQK
jgi:hypothetical protein